MRWTGNGGWTNIAAMFHIAYASSATAEFTKPQLRALLERSREKNHRLAVTGLLLYRGGNFLQVLEGDEPVVRELYDTIRRDPRHKDHYTLFEEAIDAREFPDWSMAFQDLDGGDEGGIPGYSDFLNSAWTAGRQLEAASKARRLLAGFKDWLR